MHDQIILREHKFATARLRSRAEGGSYSVSADGKKMLIYFVNPTETVRVEGREDVALALQELEFALDDEGEWQ